MRKDLTRGECDKVIAHIDRCIASNHRCRDRLDKWDLVERILYWYGGFCLEWEKYDWEIFRNRLRA